MAVLSRKKNGPSDGHIFDRINDKVWGSHRGRINRRQELFHNDYVYVYNDDDDDNVQDLDIGINKNYIRAHDGDYCNDLKNEYFALNRYIEELEGEDTDEILDIIEDGLMDIQEILLGEDADE